MKIINLLFAIAMSFVIISCGDDDSKNSLAPGSGGPNTSGDIDPSNANALTKVLIVPNGNVNAGNMPEPTTGVDAPTMTIVDSSLSYSSGGQIRLPIEFEDNNSSVSGIRFQVNGADSYYDVPVGAGNSGTMLLPIGIPSNVNPGSFSITTTIYNNNMNVSNSFITRVSVTQPLGCNVEKQSGGEGITSTLHDLGEGTGAVKIIYETYTVPDRIDVFYNGMWVAGTGSDPGILGGIPPLADCDNPTEGYIGAGGQFCFVYDPDQMGKKYEKALKSGKVGNFLKLNEGNYVEVVVSGCVRGGTAWKYEITCADPDDECLAGQEGSPRVNLKFDKLVDLDLYVEDPTGEVISYINSFGINGGQLDVDCIACPEGQENIFWESGSAPRGTYTYWVNYYEGTESCNYNLTVTSNGNVIETQNGTLNIEGEDSPKYTFVY